MKTLPKQYDHQAREKYWQEQWDEAQTYRFRNDQPRAQTFVIDTPPPTVSGLLHMGHIFSYTQADFIARYQRMAGKDVCYPMGFDDNGLPTERLVEKIKGVRGGSMPRGEFVALCREVVKDAENDFRKLFKSAALSIDWQREYQTNSDEVRALSQASFLDLIANGQAYRDFRPTYWDWVDQTAIAQAEIEDKELPGVECIIPFAIFDWEAWKSGDRPDWRTVEKKSVMTTRPELLGACVALMCHSDDASEYDGKIAITPLFNVAVPIIGDDKVNKEKGTGLVMCCTFGDDTDKEWVRKYEQLPSRPILGTDGRITFMEGDFKGPTIDFARGRSGAYLPSALDKNNTIDSAHTNWVFQQIKGLKPKQAKDKMIELLDNAGLLLEQPKPIVHSVKCAERSGTPIEIIPTHQWFVSVADKKEALLAKGAACAWHPEYMRIRLNQWIEGLKEDWCISRQRFFGVPFPVWYSKRAGEEGKALFAEFSQLPVDPMVDCPRGYNHDEVIPDMDVMDTWATSSLTPQINAKSLIPNKLFPADLRPQAHEIIRSWAFYTIVKAHLHADVIPWKSLMISGWCLATDKTKMSKSKGNVVTPVALIEEKGSDAVRYWASTSRLGADTAFSEDLLKIGRKLVTKLWNASNFAALNLHALTHAPTTAQADRQSGIIRETLDLWILSRLHGCIKKATQNFEAFEYCDARMAIEDFFWNDFCDNYLELVKARAYGEGEGSQQSALATLYHCLETLLRLFAPFVPHVTEELYSHIFDDRHAKTGSIHARGQWPVAGDVPYDKQAEQAGLCAVDLLNAIRKAKSEAALSIKFPIERVSVKPGEQWQALLPALPDVKAAANADDIRQAEQEHFAHASEKGWFFLNITFKPAGDEKTAT